MAKGESRNNGKSRALAIQAVVTLVLAWGAWSYASQDRSEVPCGVPIPEIPQLVTSEGVGFENASIADGRIPEDYLQFMAPQPDGAMPLRYPLEIIRSDISMKLPMGTTTLPMGDDTFQEDAIDSQVVFKWNQQLDFIKVSLPRREPGESVEQFVARARSDYGEIGAEFYPQDEPLEVDGMLFQHFEYKRFTSYEGSGPEMDVSHYVYFAPAGVRVLVLDFLTTPERHETARPLVEKIMRSIRPGDRFLEQMELEYPGKFGDGSGQDSQ